MSSLAEIIDDLRRRLSELERRQRAQSRTGVVAEVDPAQGLARVRLQDGDRPFVTGWIPWAEPSAGANKTHNPPSVGQQVQVTSESGDLHDAVIQGSLNSDANGRPSVAGDEQVLASVGDVRISVSGGGSSIALSVGGVALTITASGFAFAGGQVTHNGTDIGDTHKHGGVLAGADNTGTPN
ncbi:phage baseplate assembly protein V [Thalassovita aquimarina]|uniref:Phage baseplate assembly protein V n=1 Tax=Thalassovita aquimarina TaxID=2785917 RepID=A0ABS5HTN9_9RHOB|nr:phage baseplate assembly protein V [Thalassovita aquimarina]MBR9651913.1 phage baseplate assembly protein V [Thalassovita aquimarina]